MHIRKLITSIIAIAAISSTPITHAQNWQNKNQIERFSEHDLGVWESGRWTHEIRDRKLGWFWIVDETYYPYEYPTYPNPYPFLPTPYLEQSQPPALDEPVMHADHPLWFYCEDSKSFYPYVATCNSGWKMVDPAIDGNTNS